MVKNLPTDVYSEKTLLGICLMDARKSSDILATLSEDDFFADNGKNKIIFKAMRALYDAGNAIDITTVTSFLENTKEITIVGGVDYLVELANCVTTFSNIDFYIKNLQEKTLLRNLLMEIGKIENEYENTEIEDINAFVGQCEQRINKICEQRKISGFVSVSEAARKVGQIIQSSYGVEGTITGIPTGFKNLDAMTNGMNKGEIIILAARPSVGKSALALNIAYNAANNTNRPVAIFSLEMSNDMIVKRLFAYQSSINYDSIQKSILTKEQRLKLKEVENEVATVPIYIDDSSGSSIDDIVLKSKKLKDSKGDLGLIVIDYIGLIDDPKNVFKDNEQAKIAYFSRRLKKCAMDLECPILCLAQLNRQVEARDDKKPQMSDLRSSGAIEQDADKVLFMYRPAYYEDQGISLSGKKDKKYGKDGENAEQQAPVQPQPKSQNENKADVVEILIAKNRSGRTGSTSLFFLKSFGRFSTPDNRVANEMNKYASFKDIDD